MQILGNIIPHFISSLDSFSRREIISIEYISIEHILGFNKSDCILNNDFILNNKQINFFKKIVIGLKNHIPIQYILGETYFYDLKIKVDKSTLIPRGETEELVKWVLEHKFSSVLDIGTGSGCIAISLAYNSDAFISALDVSKDALNIAQSNADLHNVNINFICDDIFIYNPQMKYNIIVSNPPYVLNNEKKHISKNVLDYEPHLALFVDDNEPLIYYRRIIHLADKFLTNSGYLFFEINECFSKEIMNILKEFHFVNIELKKDINGKERMIKAIKK
jgi:release factor glutamine methyltransferase